MQSFTLRQPTMVLQIVASTCSLPCNEKGPQTSTNRRRIILMRYLPETVSPMPTNLTPIIPVQPMHKCIENVLLILGALLTFAPPTPACECVTHPACAYLGRADIVFMGKVAYSNDNGSGTFVQATLIRFEVEEAFKGLSPDVREVWVDPGSFTSCYAEYPVGKHYLVVASSRRKFSDLVPVT